MSTPPNAKLIVTTKFATRGGGGGVERMFQNF